MQTAPTNWVEFSESPDSSMELCFTLDGHDYFNEDIVGGSCVLTHYLYSAYSIGNACAARLKIKLFDPETISDGILEATLKVRMALDGAYTSWVEQGTYYLNTAKWSDDWSTVELELYDVLALSDVYLYDGGKTPSTGWPKTSQALVAEICTKLGVTPPESTSGYSGVSCPNVDFATCREILCAIAAIKGGNWTVTKNNQLKFVPLVSNTALSADFNITVSELTKTSVNHQVGIVKLTGVKGTYTSGSGDLAIEGKCIYATQQAANLAQVATRGKYYTGYRCKDAYVTPLFELADVVSVTGSNALIPVDNVSLTFSQTCTGTLTAPLSDELEKRIDGGQNSEQRQLNRIANNLSIGYTASDYISEILSKINEQANTQGGYAYITEGKGIRTYDVAVTDPLVGTEASVVTDLRGGTLWIGQKDAQGNWQYTTLIENGHIASTLITAVNLVAGTIASANGNSYWDLDNNSMVLNGDITLTGSAKFQQAGYNTGALQIVSMGVRGDLRGLLLYSTGETKTTSQLRLVPQLSAGSEQASIGATKSLEIETDAGAIEISANGTTSTGNLTLHASGEVSIVALYGNGISSIRLNSSGRIYLSPKASGSHFAVIDNESFETFGLDFNVYSGSKSRVADTQHYGARKLYCYETPVPMFADIGSAKTDEDGLCVVSIDDILAETSRTDYAYQVFLQPCGAGSVYVSEKSPGYFVVSGTPNLAFDWEIKARQTDYASLRFEDFGLEKIVSGEIQNDGIDEIEEIQQDTSAYIAEMEGLYYETT